MSTKKDSIGLWTEKKMCGEYRPLNLITPQDKYPMSIPEELFDNIGDSNIFTIVDLKKASTKLCSLWRNARKWHSMEATSYGNGLWCLLDWRMHLFSFNESWTSSWRGRFPKLLHRWHPSALQGTLATLGSSWGVIEEVSQSQCEDPS